MRRTSEGAAEASSQIVPRNWLTFVCCRKAQDLSKTSDKSLGDMAVSKRVCVVGAGMSGLCALKACLESGHNATCYEKTDGVGGLWKYREKDIEGVGSVMQSTASITSKEMSAFSDFPPVGNVANYMHHTMVLEYFEEYAAKFKLYDHVECLCEIVKVVPTVDHADTGQWKVKLKEVKNTDSFCNKQEGEEKEEIFDAVIVCTGLTVYPNVPSFPGLENFEGKVMHSLSYKHYKGMENDRCLVIGMGSSGTNVAVELARVGKHIPVHLSTRTGNWVIPRVADNGLPWDILYARRYLHFLFSKVLPTSLTNAFFEKKLNLRMDHGLYKIKPHYRFVDRLATVEDDLAPRVLTGTIAIRGNVHHFTTNSVYFKGEEDREYPIDTIVLATGYVVKIPVIEDYINIKDDRVELYNLVFPPNRPHGTLAVVGMATPNGALLPLAEMQARWVAKVLSGECRLPSAKDMTTAIEAHHRSGRASPFEVDWLSYIDTLASYIKVKPDLRSLVFREPKLFSALMFGPCVPYQWRLQGPNLWSGAKKAIMTVPDRVHRPLTTRCASSSLTAPFPMYVSLVFVLVVLFLYLLLF